MPNEDEEAEDLAACSHNKRAAPSLVFVAERCTALVVESVVVAASTSVRLVTKQANKQTNKRELVSETYG